MQTRIAAAIGLVIAASAGFAAGELRGASGAAAAPARHVYTLRLGDRILVPSVGQACDVSVDGGSPELFCAKPRQPRHQVAFFKDEITAWKVGDPDAPPAWRGKP